MGYRIVNRHATKIFTIPTAYGGGTLPPGGSITVLDTLTNINNAFSDAGQGVSTDPLEYFFSRGDASSIVPGAAAPGKAAVDARITGAVTAVPNPGSAALVQFAQVDRDTESGMSTDKKTYTVAKDGEYLVVATVAWFESFAPSGAVSVCLNGLTKMARSHGQVTALDAVQVTVVLTCSVGDKIDVRAYHQDTGITHNIWTQNGTQPNLQIRQL